MKSRLLEMRMNGLDTDLFEPFKDKRVLVTGATGLIGSLVCKALLIANDELGVNCKVLAVVRDRHKVDGALGAYVSLDGLELLECDLATSSVDVEGVDYILHAASITKSKLMVEKPIDVIKMSLRSTWGMLDLAHANRARMVYVSSMEIYGTLKEGEIADEGALGWIDLSSPRSCYPESKRMCECLCNSYAAQRGTHVCSARLAQTFGVGVLPGETRAFAQFARAAMLGKDVVLRTRGLSEGNYVDSIDCVAALLTLLAHGEMGQAYNVVNEESHAVIHEVAQLAVDVLGDGSTEVVIRPDEKNLSGYAPDVHLRLSSSRLRDLGWSAKSSLKESFKSLGEYMAEQHLVREA